MQKRITLRYPGTCRKCGQKMSAGGSAFWHGGKTGISHFPNCPNEEKKPDKPAVKLPNESVFTVEYRRVRETYLHMVNETKSPAQLFQRNKSRRMIDFFRGLWKQSDKWSGATEEEMKSWIASGFQVPGIKNASPDLTPVRTRRKLKFSEDGELQLDLALSGFDYPFLEWERRERKPGLSMEIEISFSATTDHGVIAQYERWIAQAITTLEESGYDVEVNLSNRVRDSWMNRSGIEKTLVRVKRENEALDFSEWSALFSPGGFRHLMFTAKLIGADDLGQDLTEGLGSPMGSDWNVTLDNETRIMRIECNSRAQDFPEATMTKTFLELISGKNS